MRARATDTRRRRDEPQMDSSQLSSPQEALEVRGRRTGGGPTPRCGSRARQRVPVQRLDACGDRIETAWQQMRKAKELGVRSRSRGVLIALLVRYSRQSFVVSFGALFCVLKILKTRRKDQTYTSHVHGGGPRGGASRCSGEISRL